MCPYWNSTEETVEHLILQWPTHSQICQETWPDLQKYDPTENASGAIWHLEQIMAVTLHHSPLRLGMREMGARCAVKVFMFLLSAQQMMVR